MKTKVLLILLFIILNIIVFQVSKINETQRINSVLNGINENLETHYELQLYHQKITADSAYTSLIRNKKAINILKQLKNSSEKKITKLRKELFDLLIDEYKILKLKGVLQYQFNLETNKTFLRLHKPKKFGDDLSKIRYSYTYVNKEKKPIHGLEQGKTTHGFRNVYPIFDEEGNYLCAMEISFSSELLQTMLNKISKIHTHFIVNKNVIKVKAWKRDDFVIPYIQSQENNDYMLTKIKDHEKSNHYKEYVAVIKNHLDLIDREIKKDKAFNFYSLHEDQAHIVSFYPIENIKDKKVIAWLVSYETNSFINDTITTSFHIRIFSFVLFTVLFYFIYKTIKQKNLATTEVDKKTKQLKDINENLEQKIIIEIAKNKQTQEQLFKSEKLASMGEMIGNIAHQWRQPLSIISTGATGMSFQKKYGKLTDEQFEETCELIDKNAQYLSKTIDDFKNFIKGNRELISFNLNDTIDSFLHLVESSIKEHSINIILDLENQINIKGYPNELTQCFINIFNNAKDALKESQVKNRCIFINTSIHKDIIVIKIRDNAGGIDKNILTKIFEPYFTTKHKSQGTGLGLHMAYNLIVNGMNGNIEARNVNYDYTKENYNGAEFIITLENTK